MTSSTLRMLFSCCASLGILLNVDDLLMAAIRVDFDKEEYIVTSPGEEFLVQVLIDGDDSTSELDPVPNGLFSFGAKITFNPVKADTGSLADVQIAPELDHFGFSAGGFKEIGPGLAAGKGNVDSTSSPIDPYQGTLLLSITLTNQASAVDSYPLELDFYRTLPATEDLFVDAELNKLDADVTFGSALVRVVPEPSGMLAGGMAAALAMGLVHRRRVRRRPHGGRLISSD